MNKEKKKNEEEDGEKERNERSDTATELENARYSRRVCPWFSMRRFRLHPHHSCRRRRGRRRRGPHRSRHSSRRRGPRRSRRRRYVSGDMEIITGRGGGTN